MGQLGVEPADGRRQYRDAHFELDFSSAKVFVDSTPIGLTRKEYDLLALLARNAGDIVPRDVLLERVWGYGRDIRTRTLDVHIRRLRKKLGAYGDTYIETIFGVGYRFQPYRVMRPVFEFPTRVAAASAS